MERLSSPPAPSARLLRRAPLLAAALVALLAGLWAGLLRLGLDLPPLRPALAGEHGPLLVLGFLGTQIGLERAVALSRNSSWRWPYLAPVGAAAGALWLLAGLPARGGQLLLAAGGFALVAVFVAVHRLEPTWHNAVMGLGAVGWAAAGCVWLAGEPMARVVPFLAAFLVLTIVGERLELSRMRHPPAAARVALLAAIGLFCLGVALTLPSPALGLRLAGAGLLAQAAWLARYDVARRTIRMSGLTRYMAAALLSGYFWLALAGGVWLWEGQLAGFGYAYDAMVHAIFLGFVFSMIFAHAAVIVPAVLGVALPYQRAFYAPLALLHASLALRLLGDLDGNLTAWRWGGVLGEVAILSFLVLAAGSALRARRGQRPRGVALPPRLQAGSWTKTSGPSWAASRREQQ
ncbi:MAG TPA: hypothetical protein VFN82_07310 [Solirubrobacterales bacterium]|nr:hypothetical protein [Solirubrobacterales bacterium]